MSQPKIMVMGKEVDPAEFEDADATSFEDYFAQVKLTPAAIDRASQIIPEKEWISVGIYSWLAGRANLVFRHMPISAKEFTKGKLRYTFEGPQLKTVTLIG